MEPEIIVQETVEVKKVSRLHTITPLSKYLAMALFIILPFVGGYVGYSFAPEKVTEIEKIVVKEVEKEVVREEVIGQTDIVEPYTTEAGITLDGKKLDRYSVKDFIDDEENLDNFLNDISNTYALNETFSMTGLYQTYEKTAWEQTQQCHGLKLQFRPTNFWHFKTLLSTLGGNSVNQIEDKSLIINLPWNEISEEDKQVIASGEQVTLELTAREPVFSGVGPCYSGFVYKRVIN
ncbi:hypothetical protein H6785_01750 [Candidatus Nomurabacteria bacterium]|nr:hypothetical protein [Candidatus Kaiserbacteria bacterium]MCB9815284.1 hypothetical protein [Candidatus Nomurabacteria bacterium]